MPNLGSYILALQSMYGTYLSFEAMKVWNSSGGGGGGGSGVYLECVDGN